MGWRGAFFCLVPVAVICSIWLWVSLPSLNVPQTSARAGGIFRIFAAFKSRPVAWGMGASGAFFMGQFILFTYLRPFLENVTLIDVTAISIVLLVLGVTGFAGNLLIGRFLGAGLYRTLITIPALMALIAAALIPFGSSFTAVIVLLGLWGMLATSAPVGWWAWVAGAMPGNAEQGGGLMVAVIQTCIALGSMAGGLLFDSLGYQANFLASAAVLSLAALLTLVTARVTGQADQ
jgi:predicted MFS family arabinose efflux permease